MKRLFLPFIVVAAMLAVSQLAAAQAKCEGPQELCAQILQLKADLDAQKKAATDAQMAKVADEQKVAVLQTQQKEQDSRTAKFIGIMGTVAVVMKIILSLLTSWKDTLFKSDRGKAGIRIAILAITLLIFLATNMGLGIPWWQALILAAGGPLSMVIHEMMKLFPVLAGKKKLPPDSPAPPADPQADQPAS